MIYRVRLLLKKILKTGPYVNGKEGVTVNYNQKDAAIFLLFYVALLYLYISIVLQLWFFQFIIFTLAQVFNSNKASVQNGVQLLIS